MQRKNSLAGGCFLTLTITVGFLIGLAYRNPVGGCLIGVLAGGVLAVVVWLVDRRGSGDPTP